MFPKKYYRISYGLQFTVRIEFDDLKVKVEIFDMGIVIFMFYELHSLHNIKATLIALQGLFESKGIAETGSQVIEMVCCLKTVLAECSQADV